MRSTSLVNDESWKTSVNELDLKTQGRYIACALIERVRGFDFPCEGSGLVKMSFPLITGKHSIESRIEVIDMDEIRTPVRALDHAMFLNKHKNSPTLAFRWMVDTMHQLQALSVLRGIALVHMPFVGYWAFDEQKYVTGISYALVPMGHPEDKAFLFSRIVKTDDERD